MHPRLKSQEVLQLSKRRTSSRLRRPVRLRTELDLPALQPHLHDRDQGGVCKAGNGSGGGDLAKPFLDALLREGMRADGTFIAFRSSLTGFAPPAPGGIVMQAFPCLFLNAPSPELAQQQWQRVLQRHSSWRRLFWPVDVGHYGSAGLPAMPRLPSPQWKWATAK